MPKSSNLNGGYGIPIGCLMVPRRSMLRKIRFKQNHNCQSRNSGPPPKQLFLLWTLRIHRPALLDHAVAESTPVWLSEFGGVSVNTSDSAWSGYGGVGADELLSTLDAVVTPILNSTGLVGYCYTQLTDTEQEQNGLADANRVPKAPVQDLRGVFAGHS